MTRGGTAPLAALAVLAGAGGAEAAKRAPDLVVTSVKVPAGAVTPGDRLRLASTVRNRGTKKAARSLVRFYLSSDAKRSDGDVRLAGSSATRALKPRKRRGRTATLTLPTALPAGSYRVLACADDRRRVKERSDRNNCRAAATRLTVRPLAAPPGPPAPPPAPGGSPAPPAPGPADGGTEPIDVTLELDHGRAVSATIPVAGGTLTTTAADGTKLTLTVPANALLSEETITLTPVASIGGLPFSGRLAGAAHLQPEGLRLFAPAALRIEPPTPVPLDRESPFGTGGSGQDLHMQPLAPDPSRLELGLMHFSTVGVAEGTQAERDAQQARVPEQAEIAVEQALAKVFEQVRRGELDNEQFRAAVAVILRAWHDDSVRPLLAAASDDLLLAQRAIVNFFAWQHNVQLWGLSDDFSAEFAARFAEVAALLRALFAESYRRCIEERRGDEVITMLSVHRQAELQGIEVDPEAEGKIRDCGRFELDFASDITNQRDPSNPSRDVIARVRMLAMPLQVLSTPDPGGALARQDLEVFGYRDQHCDEWTETGDRCIEGTPDCYREWRGLEPFQPFKVFKFALDLNVSEDGRPTDPDLELRIFPGNPLEQIGRVCGPGFSYHWKFRRYYNGFGVLHAPELVAGEADYDPEWDTSTNNPSPPGDPSAVYAIRDWSFFGPGSSAWAQKVFVRSLTVQEQFSSGFITVGYDEYTSFSLRHVPQG